MKDKRLERLWRLRLIEKRKSMGLTRRAFCALYKPWLTLRSLEQWEYGVRGMPYLAAEKFDILD